jgi:hypothetical protein
VVSVLGEHATSDRAGKDGNVGIYAIRTAGPGILRQRAIPEVPGPLRCQPFGLQQPPSKAQRAGVAHAAAETRAQDRWPLRVR